MKKKSYIKPSSKIVKLVAQTVLTSDYVPL